MSQVIWPLAHIRHEYPKRRARAAPVVGAGTPGRPAAARPVSQPVQPLRREPAPPHPDSVDGDGQLAGDPLIRVTARGPPDDLCPHPVLPRRLAAPVPLLQDAALRRGQIDHDGTGKAR